MNIHDPNDPDATDEAMERGEAVFFVPSDTDAVVAAYDPGDWTGWTECGYTTEDGE